MVRKRKNGDEEPLAQRSRGTRLRRTNIDKTDPGSAMLKGSKKSPKTPKIPKTLSTERRSTRKSKNQDAATSTRNRRVNPLKSLNNSSDENIIEETSHEHDENKTIAKDLQNIENYSTRLRTRKEATENVGEVPMSEPKKQTKKKKKSSAEVYDASKGKENSVSFKTPMKLTRSQAKIDLSKTNEASDDHGMWSGVSDRSPDTEVIVNLEGKSKSKTLRRAADTLKKVSLEKVVNSSLNHTSGTITPQSSPIVVNLTPHRSTKTPKKSPVSIGSPKTHAESPSKLSKTPRKLTIMVESPATSDKSSNSASQRTQVVALADNNDSGPFVVLTDFLKENNETKQSLKADEDMESTATFLSVAMVKKNKSARTSATSLKKKSPSPRSRNSRKTPPSKSPIKKLGTPASKICKSPMKTPNSMGRKTPVRKSWVSTPTNAKVESLANPESPRRPRSTLKKRSPTTSSSTPLRPMIRKNDSSAAKSIPATASPCLSHLNKNKNLLDLEQATSVITPRSRIRRSLHLTPDFTRSSTVSTSSPLPVETAGSLPSNIGIPDKSKPIDEESLQLIEMSNDIFEDSSLAADGTYELLKGATMTTTAHQENEELEKTEKENATYELVEPKTPSLQRNSRKRSFSNMDTTHCTPEAKKRCRVRFASPAEKKTTKMSAVAAGSVRKSLPTVHTPAKQTVKTNRSAVLPSAKANDSVLRRRSRSLTKFDERNPIRLSARKKRSISASDLSLKTPKLSQSTQNSVNRLSKPRQSFTSESKLEIKIPTARKPPNFAQIHQKNFAQMESIVDAKQRIAKRHLKLNTVSSPQAQKTSVPKLPAAQIAKKMPEPTDTQNGVFNRFGFKLRKAEAIKAITTKTVARNKSQQESNRTVLKGVRTNRRFELQMKARNINS